MTVGTLSGPECASEHQCLEELEEPVIWLLLQAKIGPADHIFAIFFLCLVEKEYATFHSTAQYARSTVADELIFVLQV